MTRSRSLVALASGLLLGACASGDPAERSGARAAGEPDPVRSSFAPPAVAVDESAGAIDSPALAEAAVPLGPVPRPADLWACGGSATAQDLWITGEGVPDHASFAAHCLGWPGGEGAAPGGRPGPESAAARGLAEVTPLETAAGEMALGTGREPRDEFIVPVYGELLGVKVLRGWPGLHMRLRLDPEGGYARVGAGEPVPEVARPPQPRQQAPSPPRGS